MKLLLEKLRISVNHLKCLNDTFLENHSEYQRIESLFNSEPLRTILNGISREIYAGGKQPRGNVKLGRQMILGDVIQYIFTGRAYYYAVTSEKNFKNFLKLILYCVNQLLIFDTITINPEIRRLYIEKLEDNIDADILYEKKGDESLAQELKKSKTVIGDKQWDTFDQFVDSLLPKTLGCPKELVVFSELIRLKKGIIIPLLLIQKIFGIKDPISPPDFLLAKGNKEIYGIEVGYAKEGQSREFSIRTSIPTFAVDLKNNMHNRCPRCGEVILYCDPVIEAYSNGTLDENIDNVSGKFKCLECSNFDNGNCKFSNYYGWHKGDYFYGKQQEGEDKKNLHYHAKCVLDGMYEYRTVRRRIKEHHINDFFAQIPKIEGIDNI